MLDHFVVGEVSRITPEAPVPVVAFDHDEYRAGGAAHVALNVRALCGSVDLVSVVGADSDSERLRAVLGAADVRVSGLVTDERRRTTTKVRVVTTRNQQVARIDYEADEAVTGEIEDALIDQLNSRLNSVSVLVVSDYLKGVITRRLMTVATSAARDGGIPVLIDPKIPHLDYYAGASLITPNHHEAELATQLRIRTTGDAQTAAAVFKQRAQCGGVLITRGEHGMWLTADGVEGHLPTAAREVSDVTGAGDTVIATLALALAAGGTTAEAAQLANEAAGIVVGRFGAATVRPDELLMRFA
jgi:rfaE bifunctional protein kinase chain/domain